MWKIQSITLVGWQSSGLIKQSVGKLILRQISYQANQIAPDDIIARVVEVDVLAASEVDNLGEGLLLDAVYLENCSSGNHHLVEMFENFFLCIWLLKNKLLIAPGKFSA